MIEYVHYLLETRKFNVTNHFNAFDWQNFVESIDEIDLNSIQIPYSKRFGHFFESIFFQLVEQLTNSTVVSNFQIIESGLTKGELDLLIVEKDKVEHIEFCYKFYLFDPTLGNIEEKCWIGPNRNDSFLKKVNKLKQYQLPLANHEQVQERIATINNENKPTRINQKVCFLGQLYIPYVDWLKCRIYSLGEISGFYLKTSELANFENSLWHFPDSKLQWSKSELSTEDWMQFDEFVDKLAQLHSKNVNPLVWIKRENKSPQKCFAVNW